MEKVPLVKGIKSERCDDAHSSSNLMMSLPPGTTFGPNDAPLNAQIRLIKQDPELSEFLPIGVNVDNHQLERYCDEHWSSNLMNVSSKNTLEPDDASLHAEICIIEKEDPDLCEFLPIGVNVDNKQLERYDDEHWSSNLLNVSSKNTLEPDDASLHAEICIIEKEDPDLCEFLPIGVNVDNKQLERYDDEHWSSNLMNVSSKNTLGPSDASLNAEICIIEKEDPELCDFLPLGVKKVNYEMKNKVEKINLKNPSNEQKQRNSIFRRFYVLLCPYCGIEIKNMNTWKSHLDKTHNFEESLQQYTFIDEFLRQCNECNEYHSISLISHNQIFKCSICFKRLTCEVGMSSHIETKHVDVVRSIMLSDGFDEHPKNMDNDAAGDIGSDTPINVQKVEFNEIADKLNSQRTQEDSVLSERKTNVQKNKDVLQKYIIRLCPFCGIDCGRKKKNWYTHINIVHNLTNNLAKSYTVVNKHGRQCNECKSVLRTAIKHHLLSHSITHLPFKRIVKCKICGELRTRERHLRGHIEREHLDVVREELPSAVDNTEDKYCVFCEKHLGYKVKLLEHMRKKHKWICKNKIQFICPVSGIKFSGEVLYHLHLKKVHKFDTLQGLSFEEIVGDVDDKVGRDKVKYRCIKCDLQFPSCKMYILKAHAITHLPHQTYKCRYCDYSDSSKQKLIKHSCKKIIDAFKSVPEIVYYRNRPESYKPLNRRTIDRSDRLYVCPSCGEEFNKIVLHKQHLKVAHDFENVESLNINITKEDTQQGGTNLKHCCNVCNTGFERSSIRTFKSHAFKHMPFKMYKCTRCHTSSTKLIMCPCKDSVTMNSIIFICPQCKEKEFKTEKEWLVHIKEYHADFLTPNGLNFEQIQKEDTEQLAYKCNNCGKIVKQLQLDGMLVHALEHMSKKCFKCEICRRSYDCKGNALLNVHRCCAYLNFAKCQCPLCGFIDESNEDIELVDHLKHSHSLELQSIEHLNFKKCTDCTITKEYQINYKCLECNQMFTDCSIKQLQEHKFTHLSYRMWHCTLCTFKCNTKAMLLCHITKCHIKQKKERFFRPCKLFSPQKQAISHKEKCIEKVGNTDKEINCLYSNTDNTENIGPIDVERKITKQKILNSKNEYIGYACPECNVPLANEELWYVHISEQHRSFGENLNFKEVPGEKMVGLCLECNKKVRGLSLERERHKMHHLPYRPFICKICRYRSKTSSLMLTHLYKKHFSVERLICDICSQVCTTHYDFFTHMKTQHTNIAMWPENICPICVIFLAEGVNIDLHIKTNHSTDDIEVYEKETKSKLMLKSALGEQSGLVIKNEGGGTPITATYTEIMLPSIIPSNSQQISSVAASQVFTSMATCSSKSTSLNKYCTYMTYACPECNISLPTQKEWHFHITTKHDFFAENALNIKDTPGEAHQSVCLECGTKIIGGVLHKQRHKLTHMPYRSFICTICLHRSTTQTVLFGHMKRMHFTPGEYKCEMCGLIFKTACERYTHAKSEHKDTEWPRNVCRICVSTLGRRSMHDHMKIHNYDREKFPCSYCKKNYTDEYERMRHMRVKHPLEFNKEELKKQPIRITEKKLTRKRDCSKKKNIKIKFGLKDGDDLVGNDLTLKQNLGEIKQADELLTTSKRRGRPKKSTVSESDPNYEEFTVSAKRKRGRPRKTVKYKKRKVLWTDTESE